MKGAGWDVVLAVEAEADFFGILRWTRKKFGERQTQTYRVTLREAITALHAGPDIIGVKQRDELGSGIRILHVARNGRKGRHFIVFRMGGGKVIEVLRLLYDGMDLEKHLPS